MVNQPVSVDGDTPVSGDDALPPLVIEDTTPENQLARESAVLEGRDPDAPEVVEDIAGAEDVPVEGVGEDAPQPQTAEQTPPPPESDDDRLNRLIDSRTQALQSNYDKQIAAAQKTARLAEEKNQEADLAARVEVHLRKQQADLADSMGDAAAREYVRSEGNEKLVTDSYTQAARNEQLERQNHQQGLESKASLMMQWVGKLKEQYSLADEDVMAIAETVSLDSLNTEKGFEQAGMAMHQLASRMGTSKRSQPQQQVPRENPGNSPGTGRSTSNPPSSDVALTASAQNKPAYSWTSEEDAAMKRALHGG